MFSPIHWRCFHYDEVLFCMRDFESILKDFVLRLRRSHQKPLIVHIIMKMNRQSFLVTYIFTQKQQTPFASLWPKHIWDSFRFYFFLIMKKHKINRLFVSIDVALKLEHKKCERFFRRFNQSKPFFCTVFQSDAFFFYGVMKWIDSEREERKRKMGDEQRETVNIAKVQVINKARWIFLQK